ncbi:peptidoglycan DD-metalloendopeptidase family protein [bacterium]|nr:peptidoglycan DD-metalloendopeptidase family protein [bacterium]
MKRYISLPICAALLAWTPAVSAAPDRAEDLKAVHDDVMRQIREKEAAYEREREKLKKTKSEAVELQKRERRLLARLEQSDRALAKTQAELSLLDARIATVKAGIRTTQEKYSMETLSLEDRRRILAARAEGLMLYGGPADWLSPLLRYGEWGTLLAAREGISSLIGMDRELILRIDERRSRLSETHRDLDEQEKKLTDIQKRKTWLSLRQEKERAERRKLFEQVRGRRSALEELARQIEEEAANMDLLLAALRDRATTLAGRLAHLKKAFEEKRGFLAWPVGSAGIRSVQAYGRVFDESIKDWRMNKGIDIWTGTNQSVHAVSKGEVIFSDYYGRMGNMVVLDHGGEYFTLYAHLAEISVKLGEKVEEGAPLGLTGHTGRLADEAVLHFEIRQGGTAVDPEKWLRRR